VTLSEPTYNGPGEFENDKCPEGEEVERKEIPKELLGCQVSGLLVRLTAAGNHAFPTAAAPKEEVLLEGWCQQSTTHSVGDLGFGPEGALFVTGGEGAMFSEPDYGQFGNVCEDPPENGNPNPERLTAEGGSLRSQSVLRSHDATHPTLLSGTMLRIDPDTGEAWPKNPFETGPSVELNARRIFAFGFRNPWRFAFNDRTGNIFLSNVGNGHYEEMDRVPLNSTTALNSGWPCYEGGQNGVNARNIEYVGADPNFWINACKRLYEKEDEGHPQTKAPFFAYEHSGPIAPGDPCVKPFTDIAGISFYEGLSYPAAYKNSLFFSDAIRGCLYVMRAGANGEPEPATVAPFLSGTAAFSFPGVDIEQGPEGNLFYSEFGPEYIGNKTASTSGAIKRILYTASPQPPAPPTTPPSSPPAAPPPIYQPAKIKKRPAKNTTSTTGKFVFSAEPGLRFQCRIDNKKFGSCHSPRTYKNLKPGKHTFRVRPIDSAGAQAAKATVFQWQITKQS
jgi:glucose/arabinose dehydrogenase